MHGTGGFTDPFYLPTTVPGNTSQINLQPQGLALRSQSVNTAVKNLILLGPGQSNITSVAPSAYSPSNPTVLDCLNVNDGAIYAAVDPMLGCSINPTLGPGNPLLRLADAWVTSGLFARVIIVPLGIDATAAADWGAGFCANRIPVAIARLAAKGITEQTNVTFAVPWAQGETDNQLGTLSAAYQASVGQAITASRTAGLIGPWFIAKQTYIAGAASATIQGAQAALINHGAGIWAGPDADALIGSVCSGVACRQGDNTHWTDAGSASYAAAWKTAMALYGAPFV